MHIEDLLTENEALQLFSSLRKKFGWAGTVILREDAESVLGRAMTDAEWRKVRQNNAWQKMYARNTDWQEFTAKTLISLGVTPDEG